MRWWLVLAAAAADETAGCVDDCVTCTQVDYKDEWQCLECKEGTDLWLNGCYPPCPLMKYRNGPNCEDCGKNCEICTGNLPHECMQCAEGFNFDFRNLCVRDCPTGQFPACDDCDYCNDCDSSCRNCIAQWKSSCTACTDQEYTLRVLDERTGSGECLRNCDRGYFRESPGDLRCIQCQYHCQQCTGRYWCERDECAARPIPKTIGADQKKPDDTNWITCHNQTFCVFPRTDCCEDGYDWWRGMCYPKPGAAAEAIDFQSYLASGAGVVWDPSEAPIWDPGTMGMGR